VAAPFGLKGELRVQSLTDNMARFQPKAKLYAGQQPVTVATSREAQGYVYLTLKGFNDRTSADKFRHALLQVPESELPPLPEGEYYRFQLIGLTVVDRDGAVLGTLDEIIETGANDVYRVHPPAGADILLPALADVIISVDPAARRMVVDPPDWR
jgi:16S rRNA processing protein RimM